MAIRVSCSSCGARLKVEDRHAGKSIACPACREPLTIPSGPSSENSSEPIDPFAAEAAELFPDAAKARSPAPRRSDASDDKVLRKAPADTAAADGQPARKVERKPRPVDAGHSSSTAPPPDTTDAPPTESPLEEPLFADSPAPSDPQDDGGFPDLTDEELAGEVVSPRQRKRKPVADDNDRETITRKIKTTKRRMKEPHQPLGWRMHLHWLLILALVPLAISMISGADRIQELGDRIQKSLDDHPEVNAEFVEEADSVQEIAMQFPDHRINGALLASDSYWHWGFAGGSALIFLGLLTIMWPTGESRFGLLFLIGSITGTVGIFLLLGIQWIAFHSQGVMPRRGGVLLLVFLIVKLIGFSYRAALDDTNGFMPSFLGFTFGVGLCEELCKTLPVAIYLSGHERPSIRLTCLVGLASGIGFGISEGITYSSEYYNGVSEMGIYLVRFLSCVALHAIWSGGVAILMYRNQDHLEFSWDAAWQFVVFYLLIAMIMHGAYDTLLKQDRDILALVVALVSFGWLQWLISRSASDV